MKITEHRIKIKELVEGYFRDEESGQVVAYNGLLDIRPKYQREFVYKDQQRNAVIDTILKDFPLNTMYWVKNKDNKFEVLDGQQRSISICEYYQGDFSLNEHYFHNLAQDKKEHFLNYELMIYICEGEESEKLEWFRIINIAGEELNDQELRNAVYASTWLSDAKKKFSKRNCLADQKAAKYLKGTSIRQDFLETALAWKVQSRKDEAICEYMAKNTQDKNADELWTYFCAVIDWIEMKFIKFRKEMKGLEWGFFYNRYKDKNLDKNEIENLIANLMKDNEVQNKKGIYEYILSGDEKHLNLRSFDDDIKRELYEKQEGICPHCKAKFEFQDMQGDHIKPWSKGGKTEPTNCQMLCSECNRKKGNK